jgi:integrase/recombinase XerD
MKSPRAILMDYLATRRSLGFKLQKHEETLREFLRFFGVQKAQHLTTRLALQWARKPQNTNPAWWTERLSMLRGFAAYWKTVDPRTEVPSLHILLPQYKRPTPHIYTDQQIAEIMAVTQRWSSRDGFTYWTIFGLLTATGMRVGEALDLSDEHVDLKQGVVTVRDAKHSKSRLLPLHTTTLRALRQYVRERDLRFPRRKVASFFIIRDGRCPSYAVVWKTFNQVLVEVGLRKSSQQKGPRMHDLRHTFAVKALIGFYQNDQDIDRKIHALSTYLGHKDIQCTYWYLTAVPELMSLALSRLEEKIGGAL